MAEYPFEARRRARLNLQNADIVVHSETLHCTWGLVSRAGWSIYDDAASPVLDGTGWWGEPSADKTSTTFLNNSDTQDWCGVFPNKETARDSSATHSHASVWCHSQGTASSMATTTRRRSKTMCRSAARSQWCRGRRSASGGRAGST